MCVCVGGGIQQTPSDVPPQPVTKRPLTPCQWHAHSLSPCWGAQHVSVSPVVPVRFLLYYRPCSHTLRSRSSSAAPEATAFHLHSVVISVPHYRIWAQPPSGLFSTTEAGGGSSGTATGPYENPTWCLQRPPRLCTVHAIHRNLLLVSIQIHSNRAFVLPWKRVKRCLRNSHNKSNTAKL